MNIRIIIPVLLLLFCTHMMGQDSYRFGILPKLNIGKGINESYGINFMIQNRFQSFEKEWDYQLVDFAVFGERRVDVKNKVAVGYLLRMRNNGVIQHRFIQQMVIYDLAGLKMSHRLRLDQTFGNSTETYRLRYKNGFQLAFNGQSVDPNELYFKSGVEVVNIMSDSTFDTEFRLNPALGTMINRLAKLEFAIDYRISRLWQSQLRHRMWVGINVYLRY